MSLKVRRFIGYWFMLLLGVAILSLQFKKYMFNEFILTLESLTVEFIVTCVAIVMILQPLSLIEIIQNIVKFKYGKNTNE